MALSGRSGRGRRYAPLNRVLVTGAAGQLGSDVVTHGRETPGWETIATGRDDLDVSDRESVLEVVGAHLPDVIVHTAAFTDVDGCEDDPDRAWRVNALGTRHVAEAARLAGSHVCYVSTDYVFDGVSESPYREWDSPNPVSVYGASKLAGERELDASATVVRTSWLCGRSGRNIVHTALGLARSTDRQLRFVDDQKGSPTFSEDLAPVLWKLATNRRPGLFHVTNQGETTWFGLVRTALEIAGFDPGRVEPISTDELQPPRPARRPNNSVLDNASLRLCGEPLLPHWSDGLKRLVPAIVSGTEARMEP